MKECYETDYWLDVFHRAKMMEDEAYDKLNTKCRKIRNVLIASINTAKKHKEEKS